MLKSRLTRLIPALSLLLAIVAGMIIAPALALAQTPTPTETPTPTPTPVTLTMETDISSYSDTSGSSFNFDIRVKYTGQTRITVSISGSGPQGWTTNVSYLGKQISSIDMAADEFGADTKTINVSLTNNAGSLPEPGSYPLTLRANGGDLSASITVTATVSARYSMYAAVDSGLLSTNAVAGRDNHFIFKVVNDGSSVLDTINLSSTGPTGWIIKFNPEKIESLAPGMQQQVDATINPPADKTIAGDYTVILSANGGRANSSLDVRVTVTTPSIMGVVAIIIVVVVIAGLVVLFWRLGRR